MPAFLILLLSGIWMLGCAQVYNVWLDWGDNERTWTKRISAAVIVTALMLIPAALVLYFV